MKRGLEPGEDAPGGDGPAAKRANGGAESSANEGAQHSEEPDQCNEFITKNRNRALQLELASKKRVISESRRELELLRKKSREMEVLVSLIQRAWSQLDIDASLLLDSLGDPEAVVNERGAGDILYRFLHISTKYYRMDPTSDSSPALTSVDEYSTAEEIQRAKQRAESSLQEDLEDSAALEEHLSGHVAFTLTLLEKLCNAINDSSLVIPEQTQQNMVQIKESYSKVLFLKDEVVKLRTEVLAQRAKALESENNALRATKRLDKALLTITALEEAQQSSAPPSSSSETAAVAGEAGAGMSEAMQALHSKISVLEQQLTESESAKAAVEMRFTERISRPATHSEGFAQDLRKAMEDLRAQCKARVSSLITENEALQEKVRDLTLALEKVETGAAQRIEQLATATETELNKLRAEKAALEARLVKFTNDRNVLDQTKRSVADYQTIDVAKETELHGLRKQVTDLMNILATVRANLLASQERELALEKNILEHNLPLPEDLLANPLRRELTGKHFHEDGVAATALPHSTSSGKLAAANSNNESDDREHGEIVEPVHPNVIVLQNQFARIRDLNNELADCKNTINDLITEIDAMSTATTQLWTQNESLTKQLGDSQSLQNAILEENVSLQNGIEIARREQKEVETRMENMRKLMSQHDNLLVQLRNEEAAVQTALQASQKTYHQVNASRHSSEQLVAELKQQIANFEQQVSVQNKKNEELVARCQELSKQAAKERKTRQQLERDLSQHASSRAGEAGSATSAGGGGASSVMSQDDMDMLDMTLNMLKCSVCKERFKSVTITRCFHLFCRECIEENIRNRSRKCPACGEKFGQDDVANVYFTH